MNTTDTRPAPNLVTSHDLGALEAAGIRFRIVESDAETTVVAFDHLALTHVADLVGEALNARRGGGGKAQGQDDMLPGVNA